MDRGVRPPARRGEVWLADLDPTIGHEQGGRRPVLIVSDDRFNATRAGLVMVVPLTRTERGLATHVPIEPPEGGERVRSIILCEHLRTISATRLAERRGAVAPTTLAEVERRLRLLLAL